MVAVASLLPAAFMLYIAIDVAVAIVIANYVFDISCSVALCFGIFAYKSSFFKPYIGFNVGDDVELKGGFLSSLDLLHPKDHRYDRRFRRYARLMASVIF